MAGQPQYIRASRNRPLSGFRGSRYGRQPEESSLFAWTVTILILTAVAIFSWLFPAYVFRNPQVPFNYNILMRLGELEPIRAFEPTKPPQEATFFSAAKLFERESGRLPDQAEVINNFQKKLYVENYKSGDMVGYLTGDFEITDIRVMGKEDFFTGLALRSRSVDFPNLLMEYLIPLETVPAEHFKVGEVLHIKQTGHLAAIIHIERISGDRLSVSVISLNYQDVALYNDTKLDVETPKRLNLRAQWPVFGKD